MYRWQCFGTSRCMEKSFPTHSVYHFAVQSCSFWSFCWVSRSSSLRCHRPLYPFWKQFLLTSVTSKRRLPYSTLLCFPSETMTAISVDRYLALRYHMQYPNMMTSRRATCVAATFWCKNFILSLLIIWKKTAILLVVVVFFALCLFTSSITYSAIYRIVRQHQHQMHAQQQAVQSMNAEQNLKIQAKKRAANTFIYYICLVLCYFPEAVSFLIWVTYKDHWNIRWRFAIGKKQTKN